MSTECFIAAIFSRSVLWCHIDTDQINDISPHAQTKMHPGSRECVGIGTWVIGADIEPEFYPDSCADRATETLTITIYGKANNQQGNFLHATSKMSIIL